MGEKEQTTSQAFAGQMEAVNAEVLAAAVACTQEQWAATVAEEERSVGVVFHHIGFAYPFIIDWAAKVAGGEELPPVSYEMVHEINQRHAEEHASVSQADTVAMLRQNGAALVDWIRTQGDEQLEKSTSFALIGDKPISARQVVEWFALNHARNHLKAIRSTLE